jgi:hypothetical protein
MSRGRGREQRAARPGDLVIDGRLRARLLGLPLLEIDAHVVVAAARTPRAVRGAGAPSLTGTGRASEPGVQRRIVSGPDGPAPPELAYAVRLIAEGSSLLDEATAR